ncbi:MAG: DUF3862 domain-containing protein [Butyricicoccus pullicaecorum]|nr:DUF3862 domain-containing protein [Butyricicoccus pullicaecorum]
MKKCKFCQSEIDKKAKVCPVCKRTLKGHHGCLAGAIAFVLIIGGSIYSVSTMNDTVQKQVSGISDDAEYITLDEYNQIQNGMTYDQVVEIIGSSGSSAAESGVNDYTIKIYTWYGNGIAGSNANVTFTNGTVSAKAQVGLE